ncbi:MAG: bifunctional diaminohydroxyphosphoribosylaminopyrimidine deaminase/5-amino-6-(5-phosphoribosylamino)uracil reductase RibD [Bacteroidota bacterium]
MAAAYSQEERDTFFMQQALDLATKGKGSVSPNPMVGCVIVDSKGNRIGAGYHKKFGASHAEVNAVASVENTEDLKGATVYVTLEPCAHYGKTPPCADLLASLPIERVVIAQKDPNPKVNGRGIEKLKAAEKKVQLGVLENEAEKLNEFFTHAQQYGRPFVTLKLAQTVDGYVAAADGDSQWITGKPARKKVHEWRAQYDAVLVGRNTAMVDNPQLSVRHVRGRQPFRIVLDGPYSLPKDLHVFSDKFEEKTIVVTWNKEASSDDADPMLKLMKHNYFRGQILRVSKKDGHVDLRETIQGLGSLGIQSILVEAVQQLASALLREGLVDKLECFIAPKLLGSGTRSIMDLGIHGMRDICTLKEVSWSQVGDDLLLSAYI